MPFYGSITGYQFYQIKTFRTKMFSHKSKFMPFFMWSLPLLFFAYQFILRLWPSLMIENIMQHFLVDATSFGILASVYYYGYAGMQVPIAILLDRFGARYMICICAIICGIAMLIFSTTDSWYLAIFSRFFIGAGSAICFLGVSKVISEWFAKDQYSKLVGFSFTIGLMGAIYGGKPVSILVETHGWQQIAQVLSYASILIGILIYAFLRSPQKSSNHKATVDEKLKLSDLKAITSLPPIWFLSIANLLMVGALEGFADVWGVPYLMTLYSISKSDAAGLTSFIFIGMLFGGPFLAFLSQKLTKYTMIILCGIGMAIIFTVLLMGLEYNWHLLAILFFCIGIMCCYQVIMFAVGAEIVAPKLLGVTIALLNCINMLGGSFFHSLIGYIMDMFWTGDLHANGVREYSIIAYQQSLAIIPICSIIGAILVIFVKIRLSNK